ncbi:hypothetical protein CVT26_010428, partial [Gymnopilus dilepis]
MKAILRVMKRIVRERNLRTTMTRELIEDPFPGREH